MLDRDNPDNVLSGKIVDICYKIHKELGSGLLESAYEYFLAYELEKEKINFKRQVTMPVKYDGLNHDIGYRLDFLIDNKVIIELKSVEKILPIHEAQLLTYMKLSGIKIGLLINFNVYSFKGAVKRMVL
jgi:GxxExxY protein